jgi:hypothetical protein
MDAKRTSQAEQLARELATQAGTIDELNGLFRGLMKTALQSMLDTEMDVHLGRKELPVLADPAADAAPPTAPPTGTRNRRNGHSQKTVQGELGDIPLDIPRDRLGTFEPQLIAKYQRRLSGFDDKILALYAKGLTTRDIQDIVQELYGVEVSPTLISEITADLDGAVSLWRSRRRPGAACCDRSHQAATPSSPSSISTASSCLSAARPARSANTRCLWRWASTSRGARSCWDCGWARTRARSSGWRA